MCQAFFPPFSSLFNRAKWKVHNALLTGVPRAFDRPQLNTDQPWLPANLSNKLTSSLSPRRMLSDFSPAMSHSIWHQLQGTQNYSVYTGQEARVWPEQHMCEHLSFLSTCGKSEGFAFYFSYSYQISRSVYIMSFGLRKYKRLVFGGFEGIPSWQRTFIDKSVTWPPESKLISLTDKDTAGGMADGKFLDRQLL